MTDAVVTGNGQKSQAQLEHVTGRIETIFESASSELFELLEEAQEAARTLSTIATICGPEGRTRLKSAVEATETHIGRIEQRYRFLTETAESLRQRAARLRIVLQEQERDMKLAALIATNARIVSSTVAASDGALARFADDVRELLAQAGQSMAQLRQDLRTADQKLDVISSPVKEMVSRATELGRTRSALPPLIQSFAADTKLDGAATRAASGMKQLMGALERAVTHLQAGDSARQRLEHVQAILREAESAAPKPRAALETLASAQMTAAVHALEKAVQSTLPELEAIEEPWKSTMADMAEIAGSNSGQLLSEVSELSSDFTSGLATLEALTLEVGPDVAEVAGLYGRGAATAQSVSDLEDRINLLGINAILVSERCGDEGHAMTEVSRQLRNTTLQIGATTRNILKLANEQKETAELFQQTDDKDQAESRLIGQLREDVQILTTAIGGMGQDFDRRARRSPVEDVRQSLVSFVDDMTKRLPPSERTNRILATDAKLDQTLDKLRAIYTMQSERDLHDELLGRKPLFEDTTVSSAVDDLDDVFFG